MYNTTKCISIVLHHRTDLKKSCSVSAVSVFIRVEKETLVPPDCLVVMAKV